MTAMSINLNEFLFQLFLVLVVGGAIGAEREYRSKSAGFRTVILICLGSFLFTSFSVHINSQSPDRIAANVVTGIGFLGAGVIFRADKKISGITTAATIWATAGLGMGIALGFYIASLISTALIIATLFLFNYLEALIDRANLSRSYRIVSVYDENIFRRYEQLMKECNLRYKISSQGKKDQYMTVIWAVYGKEKNHGEFVKKLLVDETVKDFEF